MSSPERRVPGICMILYQVSYIAIPLINDVTAAINTWHVFYRENAEADDFDSFDLISLIQQGKRAATPFNSEAAD